MNPSTSNRSSHAALQSVRLRDFETADAPAVNAIAAAAWAQYADIFEGWPVLAAFVAQNASLAGETSLIVACDGEQTFGVVGYTAPGRPREPIFPADWAIVRMLSVTPSARGRGIGRLLLEECVARARRDRAPRLGLHTSPVMRAALQLYLRSGFAFERDIPPRRGVPYALYALPLD